ncbi:protein disulfide-isomerase A2 isoform X5 [Hylobates moloch]|uniref:protein disulfide-isomerase A2 isoform X5 n=1 Tax=Hylobates moloch TaxID=81572 RepID=UPI002675EF22|nr:protein disulfide-isomerase A2 isoform X5 [Hylobates moloch]
MSRQLLPVLLLLLRASCPWGQEQRPKSPSEEPPEEEIPKEDGILVLSRHTLGLALREHPALLVEFYAPWCRHCQALAPEYSKAAAMLAAESTMVMLAKVDGPAQPELAEEFGVTEYPTLKFFRNGNRTHPEEYTGPREAEGIAEWLRRRVGPSAMRLEDEVAAQALIDGRDLVVIGFFQDLQDGDVVTFLALAQDALDMTFGLTDRPRLFQQFGLTKDTVVLFKKRPLTHLLQRPLTHLLLSSLMRGGQTSQWTRSLAWTWGICHASWSHTACAWLPSSTARCLPRSLRPGSSTTCCCLSTRRWLHTGSS